MSVVSESLGSGARHHAGAENLASLTPVASNKEHMNGDLMEITPSVPGSMGPPTHSSPEVDPHISMSNGVPADLAPGQSSGVTGGLSAAAATAAQQPKVVQTAFIHKLYRQACPLELTVMY